MECSELIVRVKHGTVFKINPNWFDPQGDTLLQLGMKIFKGLFAGQRCLIQESSQEYAWEGVIQGVAKEAGEMYYYVVECGGGTEPKEIFFLPREAVFYIKPIRKEDSSGDDKKSVMEALDISQVFSPKRQTDLQQYPKPTVKR